MKRPLVLTASHAAVEQARALGVQRPLENLVEESILAGHVRGTSVGQESPVFVGDGLVVVCAKVRVEPSRRKGWRPVSVRRVDHRRAAA
jgi:hypothetical protein